MEVNILTTLVILLGGYLKTGNCVLEQQTSEDGNLVWRVGSYRNRNVVPLPPHYDAKRKHRDLSEEETSEREDSDAESFDRRQKDKKNLIRVHFAMPFGVELPLSYSSYAGGKKGKKNRVPKGTSEAGRKMRIEDSPEFVPILFNSPQSRSQVPSTWGMTWKNPRPEVAKDSTGIGRSKLEAGYKIKEEDLDDGLMFRGLGGQNLRAQNEALIEGKFQEQSDDEDDQKGTTKHILPRTHEHSASHQAKHTIPTLTRKQQVHDTSGIKIPKLKHQGSIEETGSQRAIFTKALAKKSQKMKTQTGLENLFTKFLLLFRRGKTHEIKKDPKLMALYKRMNLGKAVF